MSERDSSLAEIQEHRAKIDEIDKQIVALLNKRAGHSLVIRGLKPGAHLLSLIHISEPTRQAEISYAVFCLKKKK